MPLRFGNKVAIVTGASQGIGREIARQFSMEGAAVVCADLQPSGADPGLPTHELIREVGGKATFVQTDVSKAVDVEALVERTVTEFGRLDVMVNNAGICTEAKEPTPIDKGSEELLDRHLQVNTKSAWFGCKYAVRQMKKQDPCPDSGLRGQIVNISSVVAYVGLPGLSNYATSKGAVAALTKTVAMETSKLAITCNAICPGFTQMPMLNDALGGALNSARETVQTGIPLQRFGRAVDQARTVLFYASRDAAWITGTTLAVDGGITAQ
ncbi:hypothetical protein SLS56_008571 [Neofusicoccum ribis]|uniref:Uncharacterized protein n=1 Tax=Neofusicoccum ribis TaxID=45134 RepID=A0ABR3SJN6_9PEZI